MSLQSCSHLQTCVTVLCYFISHQPCILKTSVVECHTLDRYPWWTFWLILNWHFISVVTQSALYWHLNQLLLIFNWCICVVTWLTISWLSIKSWLNVDQVSIGMLMECWLRCQVRVSVKKRYVMMDTRPCMPLVHNSPNPTYLTIFWHLHYRVAQSLLCLQLFQQ